MRNDSHLHITTNSYDSIVKTISPELRLMERTQYYRNDQRQIEAYGDHWMIIFADLKPGQVSLRNGNTYIPLSGPYGMLIGSYSIVELKFRKAKINWFAVNSLKKDLPQEFSRRAILFKWDKEIPKNLDIFFNSIQNREGKIEIEMQRKSSAVALKTKNEIDNHFSEVMLIHKIAEKLKYSREVMTREFTKAYGISPVDYRQKVRVYRAVKVLSSGASVTTAISESGFSSQTQFFHQFKKHLGTQPFNYKFSN